MTYASIYHSFRDFFAFSVASLSGLSRILTFAMCERMFVLCLSYLCPIFKFRCKDNIKVNNVFLFRWKFLQKIVFFSSNRLLIEPSEAMSNAHDGHTILLGYHFFCLWSSRSFISFEKISVHDRLILRLYFMSRPRPIMVIRPLYQPRYVI